MFTAFFEKLLLLYEILRDKRLFLPFTHVKNGENWEMAIFGYLLPTIFSTMAPVVSSSGSTICLLLLPAG